jgi:hypothetical protein
MSLIPELSELLLHAGETIQQALQVIDNNAQGV